MQEIWKDIKGYKGWYKISNLGRVKSLKKWCGNKYSIKWIKEENILSPTDNGNGYLIIGLRKDTKKKNFYIHRLVAEHFIENNLNKEEVNHIDFITFYIFPYFLHSTTPFLLHIIDVPIFSL